MLRIFSSGRGEVQVSRRSELDLTFGELKSTESGRSQACSYAPERFSGEETGQDDIVEFAQTEITRLR